MKKKSLILLIAMIILAPISVYASCPLGENVTKDLSGILKIMQIAAPIMCMAFSIYEVVKTLAKGDASADLKKVANRFGKRVLYTIILFFLPVLVDQVMQIADVWGADGTCNLNNPTSNTTTAQSCSSADTVVGCYEISGCTWKDQKCQANTTTTSTSTAKTTTVDCESISDYNTCDYLMGGKCTWDMSSNSCVNNE